MEAINLSGTVASMASFPLATIPVVAFLALKYWGFDVNGWIKTLLVTIFLIGASAYIVDVCDRFGWNIPSQIESMLSQEIKQPQTIPALPSQRELPPLIGIGPNGSVGPMFLGFNAFCGDAPILSVNGAVKGLTIEHNATGISEQNCPIQSIAPSQPTTPPGSKSKLKQ